YAGGSVLFYLNGAQVGSAQTGAVVPIGVGRTSNFVGASQWSPTDPYFKGSIDELRIYNRVLSASEVATLRAATSSDVQLLPQLSGSLLVRIGKRDIPLKQQIDSTQITQKNHRAFFWQKVSFSRSQFGSIAASMLS